MLNAVRPWLFLLFEKYEMKNIRDFELILVVGLMCAPIPRTGNWSILSTKQDFQMAIHHQISFFQICFEKRNLKEYDLPKFWAYFTILYDFFVFAITHFKQSSVRAWQVGDRALKSIPRS